MNYVARILTFTFRKSVVLTDRASLLVWPSVTAYFSLTSSRMPDGVDGLIAVGIFLTAGGALLLRLLASPYFIWREDQTRIAHLQSQILSEDRRQLDVYRRTIDEKRIKFLEFLAVFQQDKRRPWLLNDPPLAPLLATEPGFAEAIDVWVAASRDGEPLSNMRDTWVFYQEVPQHIKDSILAISQRRANLAIDTLFATLTGQYKSVEGLLSTLLRETEEQLQKDKQIMADRLSQPRLLPGAD